MTGGALKRSWSGEARRIDKYQIHGISPEDKRRFADAWRIEQSRFVDEPEQAVIRAHELVGELMRARGYPVSAEFEDNAADLSVDHPVVVEHYRKACVIATRRDHGQANTEDLRSAMLHYRELFEDLLQMPAIEGQEQKPQETKTMIDEWLKSLLFREAPRKRALKNTHQTNYEDRPAR